MSSSILLSTQEMDNSDPRLERTFKGHKNYVTSVSFSPTQRQLASGGGDYSIMMWNFRPQLRAFRYLGHKGVVTDVQFSPHGEWLASSSKDKTIRLWLPTAKGESVSLKGHTAAVRSINFSSDSKHLISSSDDKTAKIWSLPSRKFACSLVGHSNWVRTAKINSNSTCAATGSDDKLVKLWDVPSHQPLHTFYDHSDVVNEVLFHEDGRSLLSCSADKSIKMWDIRSHQLLQHYAAHNDSVTSISIHPSGNYLLSSSKDATMKIWDLREGRLLFTLQGHQGPIHDASFTCDGNFFASAGADNLAMVWRSNLVPGSYIAPEADWQEIKPVTSRQLIAAAALAKQAPSPAKPSASKNTSSPIPQMDYSNLRRSSDASSIRKSSTSMSGHDDVESMPRATIPKPIKNRPAAVPARTSSSATMKGALPEALTETLEHIIGQLDIITKTMEILDQRLTNTEDQVSMLLAHARGFPTSLRHAAASNIIPSSTTAVATGRQHASGVEVDDEVAVSQQNASAMTDRSMNEVSATYADADDEDEEAEMIIEDVQGDEDPEAADDDEIEIDDSYDD